MQDNKDLKRSRADLERRVRELERNMTKQPAKPDIKTPKEKVNRGFWWWLKTLILLGVGSWVLLLIILVIILIIEGGMLFNLIGGINQLIGF